MKRAILLVSGGADSTFLFYRYLDLKRNAKLDFSVLHVNYGLRGAESDADEAFVKALCECYGVCCHIRRPTLPTSGNIQELARKIRLRACFEIQIKEGSTDAITAHHRDDFLETLVMRKRRGAGLKGLCGIARQRIFKNPLQKGLLLTLCRPLLDMKKSDIIASLQGRGLAYRTDSSNLTPKYFRNRVRQELAEFPLGVVKESRLVKMASHLSVIDQYFDGRLRQLLTDFRRYVPFSVWDSWPEEIRYRFFKEKMCSKGFLKEVEGRHLRVLQDKVARLDLGNAVFFKDAGGCYFYSTWELSTMKTPHTIRAPGAYHFMEWERNFLFEFRVAGFNTKADLVLDAGKISFPLTLEVAGEFGRHSLKSQNFTPRGGVRKVSLKDYYQARHVPHYTRLFTPVLKDTHENIIAIVGVGVADHVKVTEKTSQILIIRD